MAGSSASVVWVGVAFALRRVAARLGAASLLGLIGAGAWAQVAVSSSGSPSYSHPIAVPPGIGGMQPNLSLMYAGGGVNGPVGHGWSVQGISMITRCPATRHADGAARGVKFDQTDKLCLDGQRLIQTDANGVVAPSQTNDAQGLASGYREYRTEKDSFARIRAYGSAGNSDLNGPAYFRVWTKAGQIYDYGSGAPGLVTTTGSAAEIVGSPTVSPSNVSISNGTITPQGKSVVMVWAVARISDVVGNFIDFKYEVRDVAWGSGAAANNPTPGREWNIAEVQYTGNGLQVPANKVVFRYSNRALTGSTSDVAEAYQQGSKNVSVRLLDRIETYINSANTTALGPGAAAVKVRSINLAYDNTGVTKRQRLTRITECVGNVQYPNANTNCSPPVVLNYANGGSDAFAAHANFSLGTTALMNNTGTMGVVPIDFNGDGKTDLLRWSDTPANNQLWKSNGDGSFTLVPEFNITDASLFSSNACYHSVIADFNGDGLPDLLRVVNVTSSGGGACSNRTHILYLGSGNGAFVAQTIPSTIALDKVSAKFNTPVCTKPGQVWSRTEGRYYYVADVNGDGFLDLVTTLRPASSFACYDPPDEALYGCEGVTCSTRLYVGSATGAFTETTPGGIASKSLYRNPADDSELKYPNGVVDVLDIDGDGIADLNGSESGAWLSRPGIGGAVNFAPAAGLATDMTCRRSLDFNGDGRADCLGLDTNVASNWLTVSSGGGGFRVAGFNLKATGNEMFGTGVGITLGDFNGDGRTDILRWKDDAAQNQVYLSNGDGSFTPSGTFNLTSSTHQLGHSNGQTSFITGDFLGNGSVQILRLKHNPSAGAATANQLYVKSDAAQADQLVSVVTPAGLKTTLTYASLASSGGRYTSDRDDVSGQAAQYPLVDLTVASPVVITSETEVGVGTNKVKTEFAYRGLKAALDGRGMLGFRQSVQQNTAPNGEALSIFTDYLMDEPYAGVARRTETRRGNWDQPGAQLLSQTVNTYCDRTSATNPDSASEAAPCVTTAKVRRPYLRRSVEEGWDLAGNTLPKVTTVNTYDDYGNPTSIVVTTEGAFAGLGSQQVIKTTTNTFCQPDTAGCPNKTSGDLWIHGRLTRSQVTNQVPNALASINAGAGSALGATATSGPVVAPINPAVLNAILSLLLND